MLTTFFLWSCCWAVGQAGERAEWQLAPRLARGQELVYRGTVQEQSLSRGVQFSKGFQLEARALVLEIKSEGVDLAFFTKLTQEQPAGTSQPATPEGATARLEIAEVDLLGRLTPQGGLPTSIAVDGPTTWEAGYIVELPRRVLGPQQTWTVTEAGRPQRRYRVVGSENLGNTTCIKLVGAQQSDDWDKPQANTTAWRRQDTLWIVPRLGVAQKVERTLERREPAHREPTYRLVTQYQLDSSLRYEGLFLEDRKREITQAKQFEETVKAMLPKRRQHGPAPFEAVLARIDHHTEKYPATPYREVLQRVRKLALLARDNQLPPEAVESAPLDRLVLGKPAPEFVVEDVRTKETVSLRKWKGKAILMVFYQPRSETARVTLRHAQKLADQSPDRELAVLGFTMTEDAATVSRLVDQMKLTMPMLVGKTLRLSYEVDATPRFVVIDPEGTVRGAYTGWGPEIPPALEADLRKCLPRMAAEGKAPPAP